MKLNTIFNSIYVQHTIRNISSSYTVNYKRWIILNHFFYLKVVSDSAQWFSSTRAVLVLISTTLASFNWAFKFWYTLKTIKNTCSYQKKLKKARKMKKIKIWFFMSLLAVWKIPRFLVVNKSWQSFMMWT